VLAKASLTPAQPAAQLADHFVVTDGRLARQETQLTQLKATLPSDETAQAMQVGELEATLKKGKNLAAVHAAQVAELKSALPSDVAAQASKIVELKASGAEQQPRVAAEEANRGAGGGGVPRGRCGCCGCGSCREGQASGYAGGSIGAVEGDSAPGRGAASHIFRRAAGGSGGGEETGFSACCADSGAPVGPAV